MGIGLELAARGSVAAAIAWWMEAGVDWDAADAPCDWLTPPPPAQALSPRAPARAASATPSATPDLARAEALARAADSPAAVLAAHRALFGPRALFAEGDSASDLFLVLAAPAPIDHARGELLSGDPGALLSAMLTSIGRARATVCLLSIAPWPEAPPAVSAMALCFVRRLADLVSPAAILALGSDATALLTGTRAGVGRLRGRFSQFGERHPLLPTFHPGLLVANPAQKAAAWADLLMVKAKLS